MVSDVRGTMLRSILPIVGLTAGGFGLLLQLVLTVPAAIEAGHSPAGAVIFYFSFFTILTNIAVLPVYAAAITDARLLRPFARPRMRAGVAVATIVVAIVYVAVLARLWSPRGAWLVADVTLHYLAPALFIAWWLAAGADGSMRWRDPLIWLAYPALYVAYVLVRGALIGEVPYPFLDVAANGAGGVTLAVLSIAFLYLGVGAAVVAADRLVGAGRVRPAHSI
jgi:hypothetical protein